MNEKLNLPILRPYQKDAVLKMHSSVNSGRNPIYCSSTGTGKTKTAIKFIYDRTQLKEIIFVLTPQIEIFNQWLVEFANAGLSEITGYINSKGIIGKGKKIYVVMPMSLVNILSVIPEKFKPDLIITDECHSSEAVTWQSIFNFYSSAKRIGLTATPCRTDGKGLINTYDNIIETISMEQAIENGFLVKPLLIVPEKYKIKIPIQNGDYDLNIQAELLGKPQIIGDVIEQYGKIFNGLPVMVACSTYDHAELMTEKFNDAGWKFQHIHSKMAYAERSAILRRIKQRKINGICTVGIGIQGLDIPGLFGLIWLRRTLSTTIYLQFIGRILRPFKDAHGKEKKYGIILDPVGNCFIHGRPELTRKWSLHGKNQSTEEIDPDIPKMKICPVCKVMNAESNKNCHICLYDFTTENPATIGRKLPSMVDGELVLLDDIELSEKEIERNNQYQETLSEPTPETENPQDGIPEELSRSDKMDILKTGLEKRSGDFYDMVRKYL